MRILSACSLHFRFLNDSDHKNNNTFFVLNFLWKPLKAEGEQSMHHCTHLHSIFYPACLVECYTYSIYRRKTRKGQISRKETPICGYFLVGKAAAPLPAWLNGLPVWLQAALHWEPVWVRNRDLLGSEKPKVHSLHDCFHLSSPLCFSRLRTVCISLDSLPMLFSSNLTQKRIGWISDIKTPRASAWTFCSLALTF